MPRWHWPIWLQALWLMVLLQANSRDSGTPLDLSVAIFSLAAFAGLYFGAWRDDRGRLPMYTTLIAVLGLVSLPVNGCWSFTLYAAYLVAYCAVPGVAVSWLAVLLLANALIAELTPGFNPWVILWSSLSCLAVGVSTLAWRVQVRQRLELQHSQELVRRLAETAERERIGRDLHDLLGATLSLIAIKSELAGRLFERDATAARRELGDIEMVAREALGQVRKAVAGIRVARLTGELAAIRLLLEARGIDLDAEFDQLPLPADGESLLAEGLREAVEHAVRHARASRVEVRLQREAASVLLTVTDDGKGGPLTLGSGLTDLAARLASRGGALTLVSPLRRLPEIRGSRIELRLPLHPLGDDEEGTTPFETRGKGRAPALWPAT